MKLETLAKEIGAIAATGSLDLEAHDITHDSRRCSPGIVFVAIRGEKTDGNRFVSEAVRRGATAIVSERPFGTSVAETEKAEGLETHTAQAWLQVRDARAALAAASAAVHDHPSRRLKLAGITGTNGKTTTAHLVDSIIRVVEGTSAMLGTITHRIGNEVLSSQNTTPESSDIQRLLAKAIKTGCRSGVLEVSSHAIELGRANALKLRAAVFTNLTRDHLDFHRTMESYFAAKTKLFTGELGSTPDVSIVNIDDEYGGKLVGLAQGEIITFGLGPKAAITAEELKAGSPTLTFIALTPKGKIQVNSALAGRPHVYNILAAIAVGLGFGFDSDQIARGIALCRRVPGRFERVTAGGCDSPFSVIIDYAHTDDALKKVLETARELADRSARVISVFGCGGDRDRTKRAPMGEVAGRLSDLAIVTSDNPRTEPPDAIINEIEPGLRNTGGRYLKIADRREAIFRAVHEARPGDVVVIAGKGHEPYQIIGDQKLQFDDREVAREALESREPRAS